MWPPLWSSGLSSWLQIQRSGFDSRRYQILWEKMVSGTGSTQPQLRSCERNSSGPSLENREYGRRDPSRWPRDTFYPQTLALTSPTSGGCSVGIVRSRTKATEFSISSECLQFDAFTKHCFQYIDRLRNSVASPPSEFLRYRWNVCWVGGVAAQRGWREAAYVHCAAMVWKFNPPLVCRYKQLRKSPTHDVPKTTFSYSGMRK
jgi:hypothetical protein